MEEGEEGRGEGGGERAGRGREGENRYLLGIFRILICPQQSRTQHSMQLYNNSTSFRTHIWRKKGKRGKGGGEGRVREEGEGTGGEGEGEVEGEKKGGGKE